MPARGPAGNTFRLSGSRPFSGTPPTSRRTLSSSTSARSQNAGAAAYEVKTRYQNTNKNLEVGVVAQMRWPLMINRIRDGVKNNTFGWVRHHSDGTRRMHQGWDLETPRGMHCYAVTDGVIVETRSHIDDKGYGQYITLQFDRPVGQARCAFYAHLSQLLVRKGQHVRAGDAIGRVGVTGNAVHVMKGDSLSLLAMPKREDHLHFEIWTSPKPGGGLHGRMGPIRIYGICPLTSSIIELAPTPQTPPATRAA